MTAFHNILLVGAGGSIGKVILKALSEEPSFNVSILRRASSKTTAPAPVKIITVDDAYPAEELVEAFKGQDVIVNCTTSLNVAEQFRFVDAAIAAGVRRYVPSEYGLNNLRPEAQALNAVFRDKGKVREYLRVREDAIEWTSVSCGMWLKWSMAHDFLGMHVRGRRFVLWDGGEGLFSCTTEENTALGLVRALARVPGETRNRNLYLSDFAVSQRKLLAEIERQMGEELAIETVDSRGLIREKQAEVGAGDQSANYALIETGFVTGRFGGHLEKEGEIWNEKLGLPKQTLEEVVAAALKANGL